MRHIQRFVVEEQSKQTVRGEPVSFGLDRPGIGWDDKRRWEYRHTGHLRINTRVREYSGDVIE